VNNGPFLHEPSDFWLFLTMKRDSTAFRKRWSEG